jgi:hypothetical protein
VRRAHDIPCWTAHTHIAWLPPPSKGTSPFRGRAGLSQRRFLPAHRGTPSCIYHVCSRIAIFPPRIYGVHGARLQPSRRCSPPSMRPTLPGFRPQVPRLGQNISFVSICAIVAMFGIEYSIRQYTPLLATLLPLLRSCGLPRSHSSLLTIVEHRERRLKIWHPDFRFQSYTSFVI